MAKSQESSLTFVSQPASTGTELPTTLREAGAKLWRSVITEYAIKDSGGLAILEQA